MKLPDIKNKKTKAKRLFIISLLFSAMSFWLIYLANNFFMDYYLIFQSPVTFRSPILVAERSELIDPSKTTKKAGNEAIEHAIDTKKIENIIAIGEASYYSTDRCLGCHPDMIMANGEKLDDAKLTMALTPTNYRKYKNANLKVENIANGKTTIVRVTDSGGFAKYGRIADLSLEAKNSLGCGDLCQIKITLPTEEK